MRKTSNGDPNSMRCKQQTVREVDVPAKVNKSQMKEQVVKPNSGLLRPQKLSTEQKNTQRKMDKPTIPKRSQQDVRTRRSDTTS